MDKHSDQQNGYRGVTENRKKAMCAELGAQFKRDPCFCHVHRASLEVPEDNKCKSQGSGKCVFKCDLPCDRCWGDSGRKAQSDRWKD